MKLKLVVWYLTTIKSLRNRNSFQNLNSVRRKPLKNIDIGVLLKDIWQIVCDAQTMKPPSPEMAFIFLAIQGLFHAYRNQDTGNFTWFEQEIPIISKIKLSVQFKKVTT